MEDKNNAIEVRNVYKKFKVQFDKPQTLKERVVGIFRKNNTEYHDVLKNVSIDIRKGETVALIGTNGSGKSTLLKMMTKILYPNSGTIETNGKLTSLLELGAGFHPDFTGRENIYFNASIFGLSKEEIDKRYDEIVAFSELGDFIDNPVRTYSSGMYMRLAFSIAINVDAEILLIDEILSVGDQHFQEKCFDRIKEIRKSDRTIVIVSHSLGVVKEICSRAIWLYKGEFKLDGDPVYVINEYLKSQKEMYKKGNIDESELDSSAKGIIYIDSPHPFMQVSKGEKELLLKGWAVNDFDDAKIKILVDDKEINNEIVRAKRIDVYEAYVKDYPNIKLENIGWQTTLDCSRYNKGEHQIQVCMDDSSGLKILEKKVKFIIS